MRYLYIVLIFVFTKDHIITICADGGILGGYNSEWVTKKYYSHSMPLRSGTSNTLTTKLWLFKRETRVSGENIFVYNDESVKSSSFENQKPTRFIIHGWNDNANSLATVQIRSAYLDVVDCNVFIFDWSNNKKTSNYVVGRINANEAGKQLSDFINFMKINHNLDLNTTYLVGHNVGAHIAGIAAKRFKNESVRINTIFGLDPALPLFSINDFEGCLAVGDASYVETIHTSGGKVGLHWPIGNAAFYPNWGRTQPACPSASNGRCEDIMAVNYFAESLNLKSKFLGKDCGSYEYIRYERCISSSKEEMRMGGDPSNGILSGVFYVAVNGRYPYATGEYPTI